jgi:hypothetical protein
MDEDDEMALGSTRRPCARGSLLPPSIPKQQRRSDKQRKPPYLVCVAQERNLDDVQGDRGWLANLSR